MRNSSRLLSCLLLAGCGASTQPSDSTTPTVADEPAVEVASEEQPADAGPADGPTEATDPCPSVMTPVAVNECAASQAGYGLTKQNPLEWGPLGGSRGQLWRARLACPDGSRPLEVERSGNVGPVPSQSPAAPGAGEKPADIVDAWWIRCGGASETTQVFSNMYRCGSHCPPSGFQLVPARAAQLLVDAKQANKEGQPQRAIELAEEAVSLAPDFEVVWSRAALIHHVAKSPDKAIEYKRKASAIAPFNPSHLLDLGYMLSNQGKYQDARPILERGLEASEKGSKSWADALCMKAEVDRKLGDEELADAQADEACKAGEQRCCEQP